MLHHVPLIGCAKTSSSFIEPNQRENVLIGGFGSTVCVEALMNLSNNNHHHRYYYFY